MPVLSQRGCPKGRLGSRGQMLARMSYETRPNQWAVISDASRNVDAVSADPTSAAWNANTEKTFTLSSSWIAPSTGVFYVGLMVAATTVPSLHGGTGAYPDTRSPILSGYSTRDSPAHLRLAYIWLL